MELQKYCCVSPSPEQPCSFSFPCSSHRDTLVVAYYNFESLLAARKLEKSFAVEVQMFTGGPGYISVLLGCLRLNLHMQIQESWVFMNPFQERHFIS